MRICAEVSFALVKEFNVFSPDYFQHCLMCTIRPTLHVDLTRVWFAAAAAITTGYLERLSHTGPKRLQIL